MAIFKNLNYINIIEHCSSFKKEKHVPRGTLRHSFLEKNGFKQAPRYFDPVDGTPIFQAKNYLISLNKEFDSSYHLILMQALNMNKNASYLVYIKKI